jgi:CRP/FNR family transcriptional regulator/CRP/FNR family cyclic AMP-dependent transcriptional regulator
MRDALRGLPLLTGIGGPALELISTLARESKVAPGTVVVREGEPGRHLFLIQRGSVRIWIAGRDGAQELARLGEGAHFGEITILDQNVRSATAEALTEAELVIVPHVAFEILADRHPADHARVMENLARELARRLRVLDERFAAGL